MIEELKQPEALRLAEWLQKRAESIEQINAANELRRLHALAQRPAAQEVGAVAAPIEPSGLHYSMAKQATPSTIEQRLRTILNGIDKDETEDEAGWWETSDGAAFGAKKLAEVLAAVREATPEPVGEPFVATYSSEEIGGKQHDTGRVYKGPRRSYFASTANSEDARLIADALNAYTRPAPAVQAVPMTDAARDVLAERQRQISAEGWTPEHDDEHGNGEMAEAAACYAASAQVPASVKKRIAPAYWPWAAKWWKPSDARRDLIKAGALILADIERMDRASGITAQAKDGSNCKHCGGSGVVMTHQDDDGPEQIMHCNCEAGAAHNREGSHAQRTCQNPGGGLGLSHRLHPGHRLGPGLEEVAEQV